MEYRTFPKLYIWFSSLKTFPMWHMWSTVQSRCCAVNNSHSMVINPYTSHANVSHENRPWNVHVGTRKLAGTFRGLKSSCASFAWELTHHYGAKRIPASLLLIQNCSRTTPASKGNYTNWKGHSFQLVWNSAKSMFALLHKQGNVVHACGMLESMLLKTEVVCRCYRNTGSAKKIWAYSRVWSHISGWGWFGARYSALIRCKV